MFKPVTLLWTMVALFSFAKPSFSKETSFSELLNRPTFQHYLQKDHFAAVIGTATDVQVLRALYPSSSFRKQWAHVSLKVEENVVGEPERGTALDVLGFNALFLGPNGHPAQIEYQGLGYIFPNDRLLAFLLPLPETEYAPLPAEMRAYYLCVTFWLIGSNEDGSPTLLSTRGVTMTGEWQGLSEKDLYRAFSRPEPIPLNVLLDNAVELVKRSYAQAHGAASTEDRQ